MSCYSFCHDNTYGGSAYVSGTTCDGVVGAFYLTLGDCICIETTNPHTCCGPLIFSATCFPNPTPTTTSTPTPTMTPTQTATVTPGLTPTMTPSNSPTPSITASQTQTTTPTSTREFTNTPTPTMTQTPTNTPSPSETPNFCREYTIASTIWFPPTIFEYTNCDGTTGTTTLQNFSSTTICAINRSVLIVSGVGTITPGGSCTITPTPTKTPTNTPTNTATQTNTPTNTSTPTSSITPSPTATTNITPTPTPSITASPTNTSTPSTTPTNTPTNTATNTSTPTNTSTNTRTPTPTPTNTSTNTPTPSVTPNAVCPEEFTITNSTTIAIDDGVYTRRTLTGTTSFQFGYYVLDTVISASTYVLGTAPDGFDYPIWQVFNNGDWNTFARQFRTNGQDRGWSVSENGGNPLSGFTMAGGSVRGEFDYIQQGNIRYPVSGLQQFTGGTGGVVSTGTCYITYTSICPTPSSTMSPTPTMTKTPTQTQTPTNTGSPTPTPTQLPQSIFVCNATEGGFTDNGEYPRFTDNGFTSGYMQATGSVISSFNTGVAPDGNNYAIYVYPPPSPSPENNYNIFIRWFSGTTDKGWVIFECLDNPLTGGSITNCGFVSTNISSNSNGSTFYPASGAFITGQGWSADLTYSSVCPTPTPTRTPTYTPTQTITPTQTKTPTPTPTSPNQCSYLTVANPTSLDIDITGVSVSGVPVTYISGTTFPIGPGDPSGDFYNQVTGSSLTVTVSFTSSISGQNITLLDCAEFTQCFDTTGSSGTATFTNVNISCGCAWTITASDGSCV